MLNKIANSQIFVALCASLLSAETFIIANQKINWEILIIVFLATLFIYNGAKINVAFISNKKAPEKKLSFEGSAFRLGICIFSILILFFMLTQCGPAQVLIFMTAAFCSLIYMMPFKINGRRIKGLRNNLIVKNILLSLIWAHATVSFPIMGNHAEINGNEMIFMFLRRFFFIYPLTIIYDIRDIQQDRESGMKTIASYFGIPVTRIVATTALLIFCLLVYIDFNLYQPEYQILATALYTSAAFALFTVLMASVKRNNNYYSFVVDGAMAFQFLSVFFLYQIR